MKTLKIILAIAALFLAFAAGMFVQFKTHKPTGADMNGDGKIDIVDYSIFDYQFHHGNTNQN